MPRRVVVTGLGLTSGLGGSRERVTDCLLAGRTAFVMSPHLPFAVCPAEDDEDAASRRLGAWRFRRYLSRGGRLAVLAGLRAALDAGENALDEETGMVGAAAPTLDFSGEPGLPPGDPLRLDALWLLRWLPNTPVSALAALLGLHGEGLTLGCACASGLAALGEAWFRIRHGAMDSVLVACGDSRLSPGGLLGYSKAHTLSRVQDPELAMRPFDRKHSGFVPGEGGAAFVVESRERALTRGAVIRAEILGFGASLDGGSLTAPDPKGVHAEKAVRRALDSAGIEPGAVDWVSAHGTGTAANDEAEAALLRRVFGTGPSAPRVTALKSWLGHGSSAAGAMETAVCLMTAAAGFLPPVRGLEEPLSDLNFVRGIICDGRLTGSTGLLESFGFGGQNTALVLRLGELT
ncbi:MAG: beta-ketoacyl-[acyl-carrier-protein] synthase family protein [Desulfovibrionaceae bacterium]|nr:beta-ketoacyl-[acyl-carrier-protein] synthase family protein [Desulfovibrionaceae bacterium]